jgi:hypothetical protein
VSDTSLVASNEPATGFGRISLRTLVPIRWVAIAGQALTILIVHFGLGFSLPLVPALSVVGGSVLLNVVLTDQQGAIRGTALPARTTQNVGMALPYVKGVIASGKPMVSEMI